ncbi:Glutaminyl-peptide cyclotransferase [Aphelenchoides besseyi]|nr:Glutaminyl-peptide cyclotransferase [Aphelenchoides besseyi]KAI6199290.1 Glutaminyl-peptide cyclotransferase [Aphelenchoides besseyi]
MNWFLTFHCLLCCYFVDGQIDATNQNAPPTFVSGLLGKMLQSSGFKTPVPTRNVAMNFNLTFDEMNSLVALTDLDKFRTLLKPILVERQVGTKEHEEVAKYIEDTLRPLGFELTDDQFEAQTPMGKKKFRNLIATYDAKASRRLVLACHYDSKIMKNETFIGATDSAVPCAMLLDLAITLHPMLQKATKLPITLQLLFLDGEEAFVEFTPIDSLYGARHLARKWSPEELDQITAFVLLDLLGASHPFIAHTIGHGTKHIFDKIIEIQSNLTKSKTLRDVPPIFYSFEIPEGIQDDFIPFRSRRVPIVHMITANFPPVWHTAEDNEMALDYDVIFNLLSILRVFVAGYLGLNPER